MIFDHPQKKGASDPTMAHTQCAHNTRRVCQRIFTVIMTFGVLKCLCVRCDEQIRPDPRDNHVGTASKVYLTRSHQHDGHFIRNASVCVCVVMTGQCQFVIYGYWSPLLSAF